MAISGVYFTFDLAVSTQSSSGVSLQLHLYSITGKYIAYFYGCNTGIFTFHSFAAILEQARFQTFFLGILTLETGTSTLSQKCC